MSAKDVAIGLVNRFEEHVHGPVKFEAKKCALICVDIIIDADIFPDNLFWAEVKNEIKQI